MRLVVEPSSCLALSTFCWQANLMLSKAWANCSMPANCCWLDAPISREDLADSAVLWESFRMAPSADWSTPSVFPTKINQGTPRKKNGVSPDVYTLNK